MQQSIEIKSEIKGAEELQESLKIAQEQLDALKATLAKIAQLEVEVVLH